jgi:hypothetical protein
MEDTLARNALVRGPMRSGVDEEAKNPTNRDGTTEEAGNDTPAWALVYTTALYVTGLAAFVVPPMALGAAGLLVGGASVAAVRNKWRVRSAWAEEKIVRSLRKQRAIEGLVVPLSTVLSQEGPCLAFDHVVHRCEACACTRPCSRAGGRYRAEDRGVGRFLVRNEQEALYVDGSDVRFESSFTERAGSHFHRLDAGARVRVRGDFADLEAQASPSVPDDVRDAISGLREAPHLLVPRTGTSILIEVRTS